MENLAFIIRELEIRKGFFQIRILKRLLRQPLEIQTGMEARLEKKKIRAAAERLGRKPRANLDER